MTSYNLALLPGDGIGPEVTAEARKVVNAAAEAFGFTVTWTAFPYGADYYLKHKVGLPETGLKEIAGFDAMLLGAVGDPRVKPGPLEHEILLTLRFYFDQYVNLRPAVSLQGVPLPVPLKDGEAIDVMVVRENTEDLYMGLGGHAAENQNVTLQAKRGLYSLSGRFNATMAPKVQTAFSVGLMSRPGVERITRYAFRLAQKRGEKQVNVVSKANAVPHLYGFWDAVSKEVAAKEFPDIAYRSVNVDAMCYLMVRNPVGWGVVLCPNLFGDIVSDLMSGLAGGLGLAAAGNIGDKLSMFEPVHGSAPDIAKSGKANPLAAIMSAAMLLDHIGQGEATLAVNQAVAKYLASDAPRPIEQGGGASTSQVGDLVKGFIAS